MKKIGLAVWSLTMIGATTVGVSVLCAAAWVNGLIRGAEAVESKNEDPVWILSGGVLLYASADQCGNDYRPDLDYYRMYPDIDGYKE